MSHIKIKDVYGYVKDSQSKAVLAGRDNKELVAYKARKKAMQNLSNSSQRIENLEKRIDSIQSTMDEILKILINKNETKGSD